MVIKDETFEIYVFVDCSVVFAPVEFSIVLVSDSSFAYLAMHLFNHNNYYQMRQSRGRCDNCNAFVKAGTPCKRCGDDTERRSPPVRNNKRAARARPAKNHFGGNVAATFWESFTSLEVPVVFKFVWWLIVQILYWTVGLAIRAILP